MPTYQYECDGCGTAFEKFQSMTAPKLKDCPQCGQPKLHRLIGSGGGIIFKGSGFYETDFKTKSEAKPAGGACSGSSCGCSNRTAGSKADAPVKDA